MPGGKFVQFWQSSKVGCSINATHNVWTPSEPKQFSPRAFVLFHMGCHGPFRWLIIPNLPFPKPWKNSHARLSKRDIFIVERLKMYLKYIEVSNKNKGCYSCFKSFVRFFLGKVKGLPRSRRITTSMWPVSGFPRGPNRQATQVHMMQIPELQSLHGKCLEKSPLTWIFLNSLNMCRYQKNHEKRKISKTQKDTKGVLPHRQDRRLANKVSQVLRQ